MTHLPPGPPLGPRNDCRSGYVSGELERPWFARSAAGHICQRLADPQQVAGTSEWLEFARGTYGRSPVVPSAKGSRLMSRFDCGEEGTSFIEPLTGSARHPLADLKHWSELVNSSHRSHRPHCKLHGHRNAGLFNVSHLVMTNACGSRRDNTGEARRRGQIVHRVMRVE